MLAVVALAMAAPPPAAPKADTQRVVEPGSRHTQSAYVAQSDQRVVREIQARYGECVVRNQSAAAREFVLAPQLEGEARRKIMFRINDSACLVDASSHYDSKMRFPGDTMRYALADALVRREFASAAPSLASAGPIAHAVLNESEYAPKPGKKAKPSELAELASKRQRQVAAIVMSRYGECVVRTSPAASYALLMSQPTTPSEDAAIAALKPAFGNCVEAGQTFALDKATLRGTVAMNYYRLAHAPARATL